MYIVFDIGGTKMRLAASPDRRRLSQPIIMPTPKNFSAGMKQFRQAVKQLAGDKKVQAATGGVAGVFDRQKNKLVASPNLKGWVKKPLRSSLNRALGSTVWLENDADLVGLGEATIGAGRGYKIVAYITISTGVGGVRIVDGTIDRNVWGFEPGHQIYDASGKTPELEAAIGARRLWQRYGKSARDIKSRKIWHDINRTLAYGLNNVTVFWSPEVIVLGGGLTQSPLFSVSDVRRHFHQVNKIFPQLPLVKKATLKDLGGLYGGLALLRQKV